MDSRIVESRSGEGERGPLTQFGESPACPRLGDNWISCRPYCAEVADSAVEGKAQVGKWGQVAADRPGEVPAAHRAVGPAAPVLTAEVVAAMQEGRYAEAIVGLEKWTAETKAKADERAYAALIGGIARRLAGRLDEA